jgi:hypothetical protein
LAPGDTGFLELLAGLPEEATRLRRGVKTIDPEHLEFAGETAMTPRRTRRGLRRDDRGRFGLLTEGFVGSMKPVRANRTGIGTSRDILKGRPG